MSLSEKEYLECRKNFTKKIIESKSSKKLIIAGPGAGKTSSFKDFLKVKKYSRDRCLVLTFLGTLKKDLEEKLGEYALVFTFHGYCHYLLRKHDNLRLGLQENFEYFPPLETLIKKDWTTVFQKNHPNFRREFRLLHRLEPTQFFLDRSNYYNAVSFDDSVFRVYESLKNSPKIDISYDIILVDEIQDLNGLEANFIKLISDLGSTIIAGDDDQAVYETFRLAKPAYIRWFYNNHNFEKIFFDYSLRCTEVIVKAANDIIEKAKEEKFLKERIPKNFEYFPPYKKNDSLAYQLIKVIETSAENPSTNYSARYIEKIISKISKSEKDEANREGFPVALIIAYDPYRKLIEDYFQKHNIDFIKKEEKQSSLILREEALLNIAKNPKNNLWWRVILETDNPDFYEKIIKISQTTKQLLYGIIPEEFTNKILSESNNYTDIKQPSKTEPKSSNIIITTFEGAKGLNTQHVFVAGLQNGCLPKNPNDIKEIEIRKFFVALTRARKCCHLIYTKNFLGEWTNPSIFLDWIKKERKEPIRINKNNIDKI
jgi:superfamily I DNA/RNA helicase